MKRYLLAYAEDREEYVKVIEYEHDVHSLLSNIISDQSVKLLSIHKVNLWDNSIEKLEPFLNASLKIELKKV